MLCQLYLTVGLSLPRRPAEPLAAGGVPVLPAGSSMSQALVSQKRNGQVNLVRVAIDSDRRPVVSHAVPPAVVQ